MDSIVLLLKRKLSHGLSSTKKGKEPLLINCETGYFRDSAIGVSLFPFYISPTEQNARSISMNYRSFCRKFQITLRLQMDLVFYQKQKIGSIYAIQKLGWRRLEKQILCRNGQDLAGIIFDFAIHITRKLLGENQKKNTGCR